MTSNSLHGQIFCCDSLCQVLRTYIHMYMFIPTQNVCQQLFLCHLPLFLATVAESVKVRLMIARSFFTMSIQCKAGCPRGPFTPDTSIEMYQM